MRHFLSLALFAAVLAPAAAHADTITIGSYAGSSSTLANSVLTYDASALDSDFPSSTARTGTAVAYQHPAYAAPVSGTQYVSVDANGGGGAGDVYFTTTFTLASLENYTGTISFLVDNRIGITLNGISILSTDDPDNYASFGQITSITLPSADLQSGLNTLVFDVYNAPNPGAPDQNPLALDFGATLTGTAVTPEPSSLVLLGTGALSMAGAVRRRFNK